MNGFSITKRPDGILVYHFENLSAEAHDEWAEKIKAIKIQYSENGWHLRQIYEFRADLLPDPYGTQKSIAVGSFQPENLVNSTVVVVPNLHFRFAMNHTMPRMSDSSFIHLVDAFDEGIAWLNERHELFKKGQL